MPHEIVMPQLGLTMTEGTVTTWLKQPGDRIEKGEMLFTVETDKVDMEVEATGSGYLSSTIEVGKLVSVGTVIAVVADRQGEVIPLPGQMVDQRTHSNGAVSNESAHNATVAPEVPDQVHAGAVTRNPPASPRARALAKSLSIDITQVPAGRGSRVVEEDVRRFQAERVQAKPQPVSATRRVTAERTTQSFTRAPHFYLGTEVNAAKLVKLRDELQTTAQRRLGTRLTYTDFLLRALALALAEEPGVNVYWMNDSVVPQESVDVGLAVQAQSGLLVPVIRQADVLSLFGIASKRRELVERARGGGLRLDELTGGSATLSNLGTDGVDWFQAILNPPQSVILASGTLAKRPIVIDGTVKAEYSLILTLSVDHRVLDGAAGAKFLKAIKRTLEDPQELLV